MESEIAAILREYDVPLSLEIITGLLQQSGRTRQQRRVDPEEVLSVLRSHKSCFADEAETTESTTGARQLSQLRHTFRRRGGLWYLGSREHRIVRNLLITPEFQSLGMTVLASRYRHIPLSAEHRFFEYKTSTIPGAGLGLFVRRNRAVRCGTVALEYYGEHFKAVPAGERTWLPYMIRLQGVAGFINGVDVQGRLLSRAPFINDAGPQLQNVELRELDDVPGRVFVVALRDLLPGEELFATYGAAYWGLADYDVLPTKRLRDDSSAASGAPTGSSAVHARSRGRSGVQHRRGGGGSGAATHAKSDNKDNGVDETSDDDAPDSFAIVEPGSLCRTCRVRVPRRAALLHPAECQDPLVRSPIRCLNSLPFSAATVIEYTTHQSWRRVTCRQRSVSLIDRRQPLSEFNTHAELDTTSVAGPGDESGGD